MSSPKPPSPPTPQQTAQAALQATQAGDIYQMVNAPLSGYADLYLQSMLGPQRMQLQQGLASQAALQAAMAQKDIQSRVDPQVYAMRQMGLNAAQSRLGQLYSMDPSQFNYRAPAAYATPSSAQMPSMGDIAALSQAVSKNYGTVSLGGGGQIGVKLPSGTPAAAPVLAGSYPGGGVLPSYLGIA